MSLLLIDLRQERTDQEVRSPLEEVVLVQADDALSDSNLFNREEFGFLFDVHQTYEGLLQVKGVNLLLVADILEKCSIEHKRQLREELLVFLDLGIDTTKEKGKVVGSLPLGEPR